MQNILIFGKNSYIGNTFASYVKKFYPNEFKIKKTSSHCNIDENNDFLGADCILYCAGIAHKKAGKELHFHINCDLAIAAAAKAKQSGARQFVYLSSAAVFGRASGIITPKTIPKPSGAYGKSKLRAETELKKLQSEIFTVTIIRAPMVYGPDCKGNFLKLVKLTQITPIFPDIANKRSMIYADNLCEFIVRVIKEKMPGIFFPRNTKPVCTTELVRITAQHFGKNIRFTKLFNWLIQKLLWIPTLNKLFSDFMFEGDELEPIEFISFYESVKISLPK